MSKLNALIILILVSTLGLLTACAAPAAAPEGLSVSGLTTAIGSAVSGSPEVQQFSYRVDLQNHLNTPLVIDYLEPVLSPAVQERVLDSDLRVTVDQTLPGQSNLAVEGEFSFDAAGLEKTDILALDPFITAVRVSSRADLALPGRTKN